ncbi:CPBP family intramembrane metalloprotease [Alkalihalobacillus sp. MEB130]|uniref:CPBP family intramembrane glutamic endopeptidase n=1 Tax=Alkalihalobacillus sp. MEB130 TaxID=2976704 RepID=UPI0028DE015B|nr:type II CAAX endopeptidase family protein [Alkalihalobacillus sp. MEB130]MDT8861681.1 CPBP family intramembrane metalloprotease [Alkalihalobacillus sp. MEB130]
MKQTFTFYFGFLLAVTLLFISFLLQPIDFWVLFPLSLALLTVYSWLLEKPSVHHLDTVDWTLAISSGIGLYVLFAVGNWFILWTGLPLMPQLASLYQTVKPIDPLHYVWLFIIIIPGEEWFWRGFIVKRLQKRMTGFKAALIGTFLYGGAHIVTGSFLLVLAALLAGFIWSVLYVKTRNIFLVIVSHLVFDLFLLVLFPLL